MYMVSAIILFTSKSDLPTPVLSEKKSRSVLTTFWVQTGCVQSIENMVFGSFEKLGKNSFLLYFYYLITFHHFSVREKKSDFNKPYINPSTFQFPPQFLGVLI